MSSEDTFLQARVTAVEALIVKYETAIDALVTGSVESYELDTGQSKTIVKKHNLNMLNQALDILLNRRATLLARMNGNQTIVVPSW